MLPSSSSSSSKPRHLIWTVPNIISFLRIASIPVIAWLITSHHLIWCLVVMALSSATDGLDGYIARHWDQMSYLGQLLDPIADRVFIISCGVALLIAGIIPWWLVVLVCTRDILLLIQIVILAQYGYGSLPVNFVGKTATFMLMSSIPVLIISYIPPINSSIYFILHSFGLALCWWGVGLYWTTGFIYFSQGYHLLKALRASKKIQASKS